MKLINGAKYHGYGNDFVVVPMDQLAEANFSNFARKICDNHFGLGADGCVLVSRVEPYLLRIFNRDGSEAGMSGNGARCASAYLHHRRLAGEAIELVTPSGRKNFRMLEAGPPRWTFTSDMGQPGFRADQIPFRPDDLEEVKDYPLEAAGDSLRVTALNVGNPQCVIFLDRLPAEDRFRTVGSALEEHPAFPRRTNVSFVQVIDKQHLKVRIWERGVGPTHSSGTGCSGAGVAAIWTGRADSPVEVETETGAQLIRWQPGEPILLTGDAEFIANFEFLWQK